MAWQSPSAMAGGGGFVGSGDGGPNGGHPQGTEYTLQGVMRFLQTEWHRHERDRNAWEIERAEMKSRIGRLEGDVRTNKRLRESLAKHVRLLEAALKKEREKVKKLTNNEEVDDMRDPKEIARESLSAVKSQHPRLSNHPFDVDPDETRPEYRQENERDKSRLYLSKCSQEVTYHVIPASNPSAELAEQDLPNHIYGGQPMSQQSLEEAYMHQQRQKQHQQQQHQHQQQQQGNHIMAREVQFPNHQPVLQYSENPVLARAHGLPVPREPLDRRFLEPQTSVTALDGRNNSLDNAFLEEASGPPRQAFEEYGAQGPPKEEPKPQQTEESSDDSDGWNFDEPSGQDPVVEHIPPHKPDTDAFPNANFVPNSTGGLVHRRKSSGSRQAEGATDSKENNVAPAQKEDPNFRVRFALRGHLDVIRSVIFTGGGSPSEPEVCTCSDDGTIKRWIIPAGFGYNSSSDMDITSYFTHRGHAGAVTSLAACSPSQHFSNGGRALGDGWVFSGGQDASIRVWERGRVDPKATLDGHTDAVWGLCVLPGTTGSVFGEDCNRYGGPDRLLLASGGADGKILIWSVSAPPQAASPQAGSRRAGGSRRANSISSGSNFSNSPQPNIATTTPFHYTLVHQIVLAESPSPTCISPLSLAGINFVVSYADASIVVYDTRTGEEIVGMASKETYDGTPSTGVNAVVASTIGFDGSAHLDPNRTMGAEEEVHGATGSSGVEGVVISGYEDRYIRFFDANSGQCTYTMLAHPAAIASLSLSPDGRELVSAGHDASLRFWDLEKRSCTQEITSHRLMRGEGVCAATWSRDGRWVISGGGDGVVKVFSR